MDDSRVTGRVSASVNAAMCRYIAGIASKKSKEYYAWGLSYFLHYLESQGMDPRTVDLVKFRSVLYEGKIVAYQHCPPELIAGSTTYLSPKGEEFKRRMVEIARTFLRHVSPPSGPDLSLCLPVIRRRGVPSSPRFTADEVSRLVAAAMEGDPLEYVLMLLLLLGYRVQEVGRLRWDLIDLIEGRLYVFGRKRDQYMPMPKILVSAMGEIRGDHDGPLFPRYLLPTGYLRDTAWHHYVDRLVKRMCQTAGTRRGSAYWCRRSAARLLRLIGFTLPEIKLYLRHRRVRTTAGYVGLEPTPRDLEELRGALGTRASSRVMAATLSDVLKQLR